MRLFTIAVLCMGLVFLCEGLFAQEGMFEASPEAIRQMEELGARDCEKLAGPGAEANELFGWCMPAAIGLRTLFLLREVNPEELKALDEKRQSLYLEKDKKTENELKAAALDLMREHMALQQELLTGPKYRSEVDRLMDGVIGDVKDACLSGGTPGMDCHIQKFMERAHDYQNTFEQEMKEEQQNLLNTMKVQ